MMKNLNTEFYSAQSSLFLSYFVYNIHFPFIFGGCVREFRLTLEYMYFENRNRNALDLSGGYGL